MASTKEQLNSHYHWRLDDAYNNWRANKVIPYSRAYGDAFGGYDKAYKDAEKAAQARAELYITVGMIAGTAFCGLGPVAGVIASGQRAARLGNVAVANAVGRLGLASRASAWVLMKKFTFGGLPQFTSAVWGSHGKELVKTKMSDFATGGVPEVTSPAASATQSVREQGMQLPLDYYLMLDGLMLKSRNAVANTARSMVDDPNVSDGELEEYWKQTVKSNFIAKAPTSGPSSSELVDLANRMELALWATAALDWKKTEKKTSTNPRTGITRQYTVTNYSVALDSDMGGNDPALERIDKLRTAIGENRYYIMTYQESRDAAGQTVLRSDSVRSIKSSWDDYFGAYHSDSEKDTFIEWAKTYVIENARNTMVPSEFQ